MIAERIAAAVAGGELPGLHGVVAADAAGIVAEHYGEGDDFAWGRPVGHVVFGPDVLHDVRSVTKSIVGLLYGIALQHGAVPAPDARLLDSFPEYDDLAADPRRSALTVAHALTMTMGLMWDESIPYTDPRNSEIAMELATDRCRFVLERPVVALPGTRWSYSGGATALIGRLIATGTGSPLHEFARRSLFEPLGITASEWTAGRDGEASAASGLRLTPRDLVRIGRAILAGGEAVIPAPWLEAALEPLVTVDEASDYGYFWYLTSTPSGDRMVAAMGNGGQRLWVLPDRDLVVATTFGNYDRPERRSLPTVLLERILGSD